MSETELNLASFFSAVAAYVDMWARTVDILRDVVESAWARGDETYARYAESREYETASMIDDVVIDDWGDEFHTISDVLDTI